MNEVAERVTSENEPVTSSVMFESLFLRGIQVDVALRSKLCEAGFDMDVVRADYPTTTWNRCVAIAAQHVFGDRPQHEALRAIGRAFVDGFLQTPVGRVIAVGLPFLGPVRYLHLFPEHARLAVDSIEIVPIQEGERTVRMKFQVSPSSHPEFIAGVLEGGVVRTKVQPAASVEVHRPGVFDVLIRW